MVRQLASSISAEKARALHGNGSTNYWQLGWAVKASQPC